MKKHDCGHSMGLVQQLTSETRTEVPLHWCCVTTLPAMYAKYLAADHGSWMTFSGSKPSPVETAVTAWMRVHLMGDPELGSWFYGASCKLCTDSGWNIDRKNMDQ